VLTEGDIGMLLARSAPLVFVNYGVKLYAATPGGEIAYGDSQGLYEWRDGERIHYSGGDRQGSSHGRFWISGGNLAGDLRCDLASWPHRRGYVASLSRRRLS
jgi:hypothetical protein